MRQNVVDPLEAARKQLDFAALAERAPSTKDILFKAQTIVPIAPARPWWKTAAVTGSVLLLAALAVLPWFPTRMVFSVVKVQFDLAMKPGAAQELALEVHRNLPEWLLVDAEMKPVGDVQDLGQQTLELSISAPQRGVDDLRRVVEQALEETGAGSAVSHSVEYESSSRCSPVELAYNLVTSEHSAPQWSDDARPLADDVLSSSPAIEEELRIRLGSEWHRLTKAVFLEPGSKAEYDFQVGGWPYNLGVSVEGYATKTKIEQAAMRERAQELLEELNLSDSGILLTDQPQLWLPVVASITGSPLSDQYLSQRLQMSLEQPTLEELASINFDVERRVEEALDEVLPNAEYVLDVASYTSEYDSSYRYLYKVTVQLLGQRSRFGRDIEDAARKLVEYE